MSGERVELIVRDGAIGSTVNPLRVQGNLLGNGGVAAISMEDLNLEQVEGDLRLIRPQAFVGSASIESIDGRVLLVSSLGISWMVMMSKGEVSRSRSATIRTSSSMPELQPDCGRHNRS